VEVLDGRALTARGARGGENSRDSPVALGRCVALRAGERARAAAVLRTRLFRSLPHSDKHRGDARVEEGARRRASHRLLSVAG